MQKHVSLYSNCSTATGKCDNLSYLRIVKPFLSVDVKMLENLKRYMNLKKTGLLSETFTDTEV